ncbi:MAG: 23S rRNA (guanosine(2251)-2'-O)-methyltransferase RlmB [Thermodesulfobacteriota bacterium]
MAGKRRPPRGDGRRDDRGEARSVYIHGIHPVAEFLRHHPGQVEEILVREGQRNPRLAVLMEDARAAGVAARTVAELPGEGRDGVAQGVAARIRPVQPLDFADLCAQLPAFDHPPLLLALDCIQDPHNLGSIIRSAAAAGVDALLLPRDRAAGFTATVYKVSAGALAMVPVCQVTNLARSLQELRKIGIWVWGADSRGGASIYDADATLPLCLVMGGEHKGIRPLVRDGCDRLVCIPMQTSLDSLNVATSAAILLFEIIRQRTALRPSFPGAFGTRS